jgi:hypothetical protein
VKDFSLRVESLKPWKFLQERHIVGRKIKVDFTDGFARELGKFLVRDTLEKRLGDVSGTDVPAVTNGLGHKHLLGRPGTRSCVSSYLFLVSILETSDCQTRSDDLHSRTRALACECVYRGLIVLPLENPSRVDDVSGLVTRLTAETLHRMPRGKLFHHGFDAFLPMVLDLLGGQEIVISLDDLTPGVFLLLCELEDQDMF